MASPVRSVVLSAFVLSLLAGCAGEPPVGPEGIALRAAKGGNGPNGGGGGDPTVEAADPSSAPQDTTLEVRVLGSNFEDGSRVDFLLDGKSTTKVTTNSTRFVSGTELVANITIALDAQADLYDIQVTTSRGKKGVGIELFEITLSKWGQLALEITFRDDEGDGLRSDGMMGLPYCDPGVPCYEQGQETAARLSGNGNLMFWLYEDSSRRVEVLGELLLTRRIYTNDTQDDSGTTIPGLFEMPDGTATVRLVVERGNDEGHYRFGMSCISDQFDRDDANSIPGERIQVTRTGYTWVLEGWGARHCITIGKGKNATVVETPYWMPFRMTLVGIPWPE